MQLEYCHRCRLALREWEWSGRGYCELCEDNMTDPKPRGGSRPGSGRKPDPNARKMVSLRLSLETVDYLATVDNKTEAIEQAVKNSKAYKAWKANRPKTAKGE